MVNKEAVLQASSAGLHPDSQTWSALETPEHGGRVLSAHVALLGWGHRSPAGLGPLWLCGAVAAAGSREERAVHLPTAGNKQRGHARFLLTHPRHTSSPARSHTPNCMQILKQLLRDS